MKKNIIIDATQQQSHITGTDRLAHNVLRELQTLDTENHYTVICTKGFDYIPSAISAPNFTVARQGLYKRYWKLAVMPFRALRLLRRKYVEKPDLFFSFHNLNSPRIKFSPVVSSALDLIPLLDPDNYHRGAGAYQYYKNRVAHTVSVAERFVAISHHTKRDLVEHLQVPEDRVDVVHLAAEDKFRPVTDEAILKAARERYGLPERFILTIGANEPRKNARGVIAAYQALPEELRRDVKLAVMGKQWNDAQMEGLQAEGVIFTGFVDDEDLPTLYAAAEVFVFLSLYEGFGMPILESMLCGTPVVSSNTSSLPEVYGEAALAVDPTDTAGAAEAIGRILSDPSLRAQLREDGLAQARKFNWRKTAEGYLAAFRKEMK